MMHILAGSKITIGLCVAAALMAGLWRWEVVSHDHTKQKLAVQEVAAQSAAHALEQLNGLVASQTDSLEKREAQIRANQADLVALRKAVQKERAHFAKSALQAPFTLGNSQRRDLVRILCLSCENRQRSDTATAFVDPSPPDE